MGVGHPEGQQWRSVYEELEEIREPRVGFFRNRSWDKNVGTVDPQNEKSAKKVWEVRVMLGSGKTWARGSLYIMQKADLVVGLDVMVPRGEQEGVVFQAGLVIVNQGQCPRGRPADAQLGQMKDKCTDPMVGMVGNSGGFGQGTHIPSITPTNSYRCKSVLPFISNNVSLPAVTPNMNHSEMPAPWIQIKSRLLCWPTLYIIKDHAF